MMADETAQMLASQLDRLLADEVDPASIARSEAGQGNGGLDAALADLGLDLALVPEEQNGAGLEWRDLGPVLQTLGYHAAPCDLAERMVACHLLALLGLDVDTERSSIALDPLTREGETVSGAAFVPWARPGAAVLAEAGGRLCLVDASAAGLRPAKTVGRIPSATIAFDRARIIASAPLPPVGPVGLMAVVRSAQIAGALSRILELSIEYSNTRRQFGKAIGRFQAVQHLIARLAGEAGCAKAAAEIGLAALDAGTGWQGVAVAKIRTSRAVGPGTDSAHQVHGAIGVTEEHTLHCFTRRLWQWREEAGNEHVWSERLGRAAIRRGDAAFWPSIVELTGQKRPAVPFEADSL